MKTIFNEEHKLPDFVDQWINPVGNWDDATRKYGPLVESSRRYGFHAVVRAHYDHATGALVIALNTTLFNSSAWRPAARKVLELHDSRESALRRTIQVADDWYHEVETMIPPEYTEAELLASYHAGQPLVKVFD